MFPYLLIQTVFVGLFAWAVSKIGLAMFKVTSVKTAIEHYEAHPDQGTVIEKYFYGWYFPINRTIMKKLSAGNGDKFITAWYKVSGVIFMIFAVFFVAGTIFAWIAMLSS